MNLLLGVGIFLPAVFIGVLVVHQIWDELQISALFVKLFVGIGVGIGLNSLLYFLYLLFFAGRHFFMFVQAGILVSLLVLTLRRERMRFRIPRPVVHMNYWQIALLAVVLLAIAFSISGALTVWIHRPSGTWDAYMIYNRTARFVYRSQADWLQSFSRQLDPVFHADYPLLIPLGIASSWDILGRESPYVPLVLSGILMFACAGLFTSALALAKSVSQAGVGLIILLNTPIFLITGASQTADVPLSFLILATAVLAYLYASRQERGLLVLAGLTSGLAAWTKNEGQLFMVVTGVSLLFLAFLKPKPWPRLGSFLVGLFFPLVLISYFKLFLAPPNDLLGSGLGHSIQPSLDWQRHLTILGQYWEQTLSFGRSWIGVAPILLAYVLVFGISRPGNGLKQAYWIIMLMVALQLLGYYFVYLFTPHPLAWQLEFSLERVLLHVYLPVLFLLFMILTDVTVALDFKGQRTAPASAA